MNYSRIGRNHNCNFHTDQVIISVCLEEDCYRPVLCLQCISDPEIHPSTHNKIISVDDFFTGVDEYRKKGPAKSEKAERTEKIKEAAQNHLASIAEYKEHIETQKTSLDDAINELISSFVLDCHEIKQQAHKKLDAQLENYSKNCKNFVKAANKLPEEKMVNNSMMKQSSFEDARKLASYDQIEKLIRKYQKELSAGNKSPNKGKPTEEEEHLVKLNNVSQQIEHQNKTKCFVQLTDVDLELAKGDLLEGAKAFFEKYLAIRNEAAPVEIAKPRALSKIIKNQETHALLNSFMVGLFKEPTYDIIYRGSTDGMTSDDFHRKCDGVANTLILIRNDKGQLFGGFTDKKWTMEEKYENSSKSFLFSLDLKEKYILKPGQEDFAIKGCYELGPCFGAGHDLRLSQDFAGETSSGYIGFSYDARGKQAKDIYGGPTFYIDEIEVLKVSENGAEDEDDDVEIIKQVSNPPQKNDKNDENWERILDKNNGNGSPSKNQNPNEIKSPSISKVVSYEELEKIMNWIDPKRNFTLDLIYRGSRDGYNSEHFHNKCDKMGPTLTLVKTLKNQQIFGGFTKQSWDKSNSPARCPDTFLFSLTKDKKFPILDKDNAIFRSPSTGPVFGNGDIFICSDCNTKEESYSNLGVGFDAADLENSVVFFADDQYFCVDDIEVFQVIFIE